ncbi:P-loop containing nucleoside triphosphate hydrolase protein [Zychaea mexicana]|uniref:P-loop containing nucleoside triphosphate hydrolase protein n=1 Tax=Zychaea mexicana TaxID=64656 RepID=UPI0022FE1578|nr:P-loop containing nucleoside triphosphate hydrolase protein [Zychaea mexicana]KAI9488391.1 P-loop containing nucleoside triphosphate hydrolase protein [Zychaea mexicana]
MHNDPQYSSSPWNHLQKLKDALPPEVDDAGNVEYKLKLVDPSIERLDHLITQMKWRLSEGGGEAMYELGVDDDGTLVGLSAEDMSASVDTLRQMADALDADVSIIRELTMDQFGSKPEPRKNSHKVLEALIRRRPKDQQQQFTDIRIAMLGGHGEGKSTLLGCITHGIQDNGRGRARLSCARHRHEIESGRTSSISHEIIGYDADGHLINYASTHNISTWEQICEASSKVITFLDLCGHAKYLRTTISGMTGYSPDYAALVISASTNVGISEMAREHLSLAVMLDVPVLVIVTKVDVASRNQLGRTLNSLVQLLRAPGMNKVPVIVRDDNDSRSCASHLARGGPEIPIFLVSNVTGTNVDLLERFFNYLPRPTKNYDALLEEPVEFQVEEVYSLSDIGPVIGGVLRRGRININEDAIRRTYHLGPDSTGAFVKVTVDSIHRHRVPTHYVHCGQAATLAIKSTELENWRIQRGMVLLGIDVPSSYFEFEVDLIVLYHPTGVTVGTCGMVHSGSVRQRARVVSISSSTTTNTSSSSSTPSSSPSSSATTTTTTTTKEAHLEEYNATKTQNSSSHPSTDQIIPSGSEGRCVLRFMNEPKYLCNEAQILFMEGKAKCLGRVIQLINTT